MDHRHAGAAASAARTTLPGAQLRFGLKYDTDVMPKDKCQPHPSLARSAAASSGPAAPTVAAL